MLQDAAKVRDAVNRNGQRRGLFTILPAPSVEGTQVLNREK